LCEGVGESKEIGRRLGMDEREVVKGRKKLDRRVGEFGRKKLKAWHEEAGEGEPRNTRNTRTLSAG
jgi:hypothetical protein